MTALVRPGHKRTEVDITPMDWQRVTLTDGPAFAVVAGLQEDAESAAAQA